MHNDVQRIWFAILTVVGKIMASDLCGLVESTIVQNRIILLRSCIGVHFDVHFVVVILTPLKAFIYFGFGR
jgi:hypothetical protein